MLEQRLPLLAALDALVNNADRKSAHLLVSRDMRLWGIDNGLTFLPYPRQRTVLLQLGGTPLPDDAADAVARLQGEQRCAGDGCAASCSACSTPRRSDAFLGRLEELAGDPRLPGARQLGREALRMG